MDTTQQAELSLEMKREKEKLLWDELRHLRDTSLQILQWGATVLVSLQTALFFLRKQIYEQMPASQQLQAGGHLPASTYLLGTLYLFVVASVFSYLLTITGTRYRKIREQLVNLNLYGIIYGEAGKSARWISLLVFYAFPICDLILRGLYIHFEVGFR